MMREISTNVIYGNEGIYWVEIQRKIKQWQFRTNALKFSTNIIFFLFKYHMFKKKKYNSFPAAIALNCKRSVVFCLFLFFFFFQTSPILLLPTVRLKRIR